MADAFLGEWKLVSSENLDELMKELGVGMVLRKLGSTTKPTVKITRNGDDWTLSTLSTLKNHSINYKLDEEFDEDTLDGRKTKTVISMDGNKLVQTQKDKNGNLSCLITREINEKGELITLAKAGAVESVRVYVKQ